MNKLICFGEILIDQIKSKDSASLNYAGGAPANVAVGFSKLGGNSTFVGGIGTDDNALFLVNELKRYNVNIDCLKCFEGATTATAIVSLDEKNDRSFKISRDNTADTMFTKKDFTGDLFNKAFAFHFCSNTLTETSLFDATEFAIKKALDNQLVVSFDVNLRFDLWKSDSEIENRVSQLISQSDIIKMSLCELEYLADASSRTTERYLEYCLNNQASIIIITDGAKRIDSYTKQYKTSYHPIQIDVIDTTAAGDSFMAGFLFYASNLVNNVEDFSKFCKLEHNIKKALEVSSSCGGLTCQSKGAFSALPTDKELEIPKSQAHH